MEDKDFVISAFSKAISYYLPDLERVGLSIKVPDSSISDLIHSVVVYREEGRIFLLIDDEHDIPEFSTVYLHDTIEETITQATLSGTEPLL